MIDPKDARIAELEAKLAEAERVQAECYQAVGMLGEMLRLDDNEDFIRLQDMLAYGKTQDGKELLPFPVLSNERAEKAEAQLTAATALLGKARKGLDWYAEHGGNLARALCDELDSALAAPEKHGKASHL